MLTRSISSILLCLLLLLSPAFLPAQDNLTVPLEDSVYQVLEHAQIRGYIDRLPSIKPYTRVQVRKALQQLEQKVHLLSPVEQAIVQGYLADIKTEKADAPVWQTASVSGETDHTRTEMGMNITTRNGVSFQDEERYTGSIEFFNFFLEGGFRPAESPDNSKSSDVSDVSDMLSYKLAMDFAVRKVDNTKSGFPRSSSQFAAFAPYSFTKPWDPERNFPLFDLFQPQRSGLDSPVYLDFRMQPEIGASWFDDLLQLRFSRTPRNWGPGEDSILLSGQARPFLALETHAKLFPWMDYSVLVGTLESSTAGVPTASRNQSMLTLKTAEIRPFSWLYAAVHESVVWPKRFELGYINPVIFSSLYQWMTGNFDNIMGGLTLGGSIPGLLDVYGTLYIDEFKPTSFADMFQRVRNLFSYKAAAEFQIPWLPFGTGTVQYTKIEPFVYTHPPTENPWVTPVDGNEDLYPYQSFISDGYGIPSRLDPNSDELLIKTSFFPHSKVQLTGSYQMIRHGHYGGFYDMPPSTYSLDDDEDEDETVLEDDTVLPAGMNYPTWLGGGEENLNDMQKDFLHDGDYEWYHIFTIDSNFELDEFFPIPVSAAVSYSYVYQYMQDHEGNRLTDVSSTLRPDFIDGNRHFLTLAVNLY